MPSSSTRPFSGIDRKGLARAAELMRGSYCEHALIARNIAYVAIQIKDRDLACETHFGARDAETLGALSSRADSARRLLVAAKIGKTRLIDNLKV